MYSFVSDLPDYRLWGLKYVGGTSQNYRWLFVVTCAVGWIKYCMVYLLHRMWTA